MVIAACATGPLLAESSVPPPQVQIAQHPLRPPDRSTPQATIRTFLNSCDDIARQVSEKLRSSPTRADYLHMRELAVVPVGCLDLHEVAPVSRLKVGLSTALELYEVLAKVDLSGIDAAASPSPAAAAAKAGAAASWTLPGTEIRLVQNEHGEWIFSAETVSRTGGFAERVEQLEYTRPMPMEGLHRVPAEIGGWMVSYSMIESLPAWLRKPVLGQAVWKWIALLLLLGLVAALIRPVYLFSRRGSEERPLGQAIRRLTLPAFTLAATPVVAYFAILQINLFGEVAVVFLLATTAALYASAAWLAWRAAPVLAEAIIASPQIPDQSIDAHLIRIVARLVGVAVAAGLLAIGADQVGVPLYGVLAGLGVGGLALALAAQPTIENLIGGLSLFADKPMKVGDSGTFGDVTGTVEAIGIRSTRIRGADRTVTSVPNATLSKATLVNFNHRDMMLLKTVIGLRYETSPDQLRFVLDRLRNLLTNHPRVVKTSVKVQLIAFNTSSLDIDVSAYLSTHDGAEFGRLREEIFLQIMDLVDEAGSSFAFPSMVHYRAEDSGLNREKAKAAEAEVRRSASPTVTVGSGSTARR